MESMWSLGGLSIGEVRGSWSPCCAGRRVVDLLTLAAREYFDRFSSYQEVYGRTASAAMLLMWMYITSATVLLGAELNSEIEKAGAQPKA